MSAKLSLNLVTIKQAGLQQQLELVQSAGYKGVGLWVNELHKLAQEGTPPSDVAALMRRLDLEAAELCFVGGWMYADGDARKSAFHNAEQAFKLAQVVGCPTVIACAAGHTGDIEQATTDFSELCDLAARYDVRAALEFIGPAQQVKDVATAWQIVEAADHPNGGVLIDTYHFYRGASTFEDLDEVPGDKIFCVHINDCMDLPREQLTDLHRVYPGLGILPLAKMISALSAKGYDGYYSLEIFNEEYWAADPRQVATDGMHSLTKLFGR